MPLRAKEKVSPKTAEPLARPDGLFYHEPNSPMTAPLQPAADLRAPDRRPLNWRLITARRLLAEADEDLPHHDDPWINDLAQLCYLGRLRNQAFAPTARHRAIRDAVLLKESGTLSAEVLEARLLAGLSPAWIADHSSIRLDVIAAYGALFFDVSLPDATQRWFQTGLLANLKPGNRTIWELGTYLKKTGIMLGAAALEHSIGLLAGLEGPTLADGLTEPGTVDFASDVLARGSIALCLLRSPRQLQRLHACLLQFRQACDSGTPPDATPVIELFQRAKITKALKAQFQQLRSDPAASSKEGA